MNDWILIPIMLIVFGFCFFMITKLDLFIDRTKRMIAKNEHQYDHHILIATESHVLLDDISPALEYCTDSTPHLELFTSCSKSNKILHKLSDGKLDIGVLTEESVKNLEPQFRSIQITHPAHGQSADNADDTFAVVWNRNVVCKERDRVIFMIENELCSLKQGYCDYL